MQKFHASWAGFLMDAEWSKLLFPCPCVCVEWFDRRSSDIARRGGEWKLELSTPCTRESTVNIVTVHLFSAVLELDTVRTG